MQQQINKAYTGSRSGFTLVELLIAITIIAVLTTMGFNVYTGVQARARDSRRMDDLKKIQLALELYHNEFGYYPPTSSPDQWYNSKPGDFWLPGLTSKYLPKMPADPINKGCSGNNTNPRDDTGAPNCLTYAYYSGPGFCNLSGVNDGYILATKLESRSGSDLSQQPYYNSSGTLCGNWSDSAVEGLYVVRNP